MVCTGITETVQLEKSAGNMPMFIKTLNKSTRIFIIIIFFLLFQKKNYDHNLIISV